MCVQLVEEKINVKRPSLVDKSLAYRKSVLMNPVPYENYDQKS